MSLIYISQSATWGHLIAVSLLLAIGEHWNTGCRDNLAFFQFLWPWKVWRTPESIWTSTFNVFTLSCQCFLQICCFLSWGGFQFESAATTGVSFLGGVVFYVVVLLARVEDYLVNFDWNFYLFFFLFLILLRLKSFVTCNALYLQLILFLYVLFPLLLAFRIIVPRVKRNGKVHLQKERIDRLTRTDHFREELFIKLRFSYSAQHVVDASWRVLLQVLLVDIDTIWNRLLFDCYLVDCVLGL